MKAYAYELGFNLSNIYDIQLINKKKDDLQSKI